MGIVQMVWNWLEDVQHQVCHELASLKNEVCEISSDEYLEKSQSICKLLGERRAYQRMLVKVFLVDNAEIKSKMQEISNKYL